MEAPWNHIYIWPTLLPVQPNSIAVFDLVNHFIRKKELPFTPLESRIQWRDDDERIEQQQKQLGEDVFSKLLGYEAKLTE